MKDYAKAVKQAGIGGTPQLCQDAMVEMLKELFDGRCYAGQEGQKELGIYKQDLPVPSGNDSDVDTDIARAPYVVVEMNEGAILDNDSPQNVEFSLIICAYDDGLNRDGIQDVANIKEAIIQRLCARPYFGGVFTVLKPITWALQKERTPPYYYGAVTCSCTAPAMTQDTEMEDLV